MVRDHRAFLGESLDMRGFLLQIAQRNEERESTRSGDRSP